MDKEKRKETPPPKEKEGNVYINFDDVILNLPIPFEYTRSGRKILRRLIPKSSCCSSSCHSKDHAPAETRTAESAPLSVTLDATWELRLNPGDYNTPSSVLIEAIRVEFSWNASGSQGTTVDIQAMTLDLKGKPCIPYAKWTNIITNQRPVGMAVWTLERQVIGNRIRFQAIARDKAGNEAYSNIITATPGTPTM